MLPVLPSFEVKLTVEQPFFHVNNQDFTVNIKATYLFGQQVEGTAYVVFGLMHQDQKQSMPSSLQRVPIKGGNGVVKLKRDHITFQNIQDLVGSSIFVTVSVLTESGSEMVEAELRNIRIVTSPYTINFKKTPKYFKPGMAFDVVVEVANPDGTPAKKVKVVINPGNVEGFTAANGVARLSVNTDETIQPLTITARVLSLNNGSATMVAQPYSTQSKSYISIMVDVPEVKIGDSVKVVFNLNKADDAQTDVTYLIQSRGQLVESGREVKRPMIAKMLLIKKEMLPSFRIIAYYLTNNNEVVSDSVWVDAEDSCMGSLTLEKPPQFFEPGKMFNLKVTGDPGAKVGLVAVDKGVYVLNNKHRLTQKKVWDVVEKYDTGCTPGGGRDSMNVFYDAGLFFESNMHDGTPNRIELKCPEPSRRKRASSIQDVRASLSIHYKKNSTKLRECCLDGMKDSPLSYNCERRSQYIVDDPACVKAFLHCCSELENQRDERKQDSLLLARSEDDSNYFISDFASRTQFPESWYWTDTDLPSCPEGKPNCDSTTFEEQVVLKDSITTWLFSAISLSRTHGICVGVPIEVVVRKVFFIDLRLPYSAVRGEQVEIKAVLHNYTPEDIDVLVELIEAEHVCSSASTRKRFRQEVRIGSKTTRSVPFIIIPMKDGKFDIEVKAFAKNEYALRDGVRKKLLVVPEGVLTRSLKSITLDPANKGVDGTQARSLNAGISETDLVPNTPSNTYIYVTGREQLGALVENAISGNSMGTLIREPSGCGEQNIASMTLPVIATTYLDTTNQWETVGFGKRNVALQHIKTGYQTELNYRKTDGSFSVFPDRVGSTWLTAYVAKVFAMANKLVQIKKSDICEAIKFLILNAQQPDGAFTELGEIIHSEMIGDVRGTDSEASLSAFCLIAMQESRSICNETVNSLPGSIRKTTAYLERSLPGLTKPYAVAMTSYALANEKKLNRQILYNFVSESNHWPVLNSDLYTLEATAYALLALVKDKRFQDAKPVVRWFNQKQIYGGGYGSTQATILVYQAIAEYWVNANEQEYNVNVDIVHPKRKDPARFHINRNNQYSTRTSKSKGINEDVMVIATGTGEATVNMVSLYYARPKERESDCQKFNLSVKLDEVKMDGDEMVYKLVIHVLFKDKTRSATMTILDIGLLTGFEVNTDDLNTLSTGVAKTISRYEPKSPMLSDRGSLIIYLNEVSNVETQEVAFKVRQKLRVGVLQPAAVSVYEYYNHNNINQSACVKFYHPERKDGELLRLCRNNECTCAEENCSMQKKEKIDNNERTSKVCEANKEHKVDFVYKMRLENFTEEVSTHIYTMRVVEVIKEGSDKMCQKKPGQDLNNRICDLGLGPVRPFLSFKHCRVGLNLKIGSTYLVMGRATDIHKDEEKQSYMYVLGERTWIEYWPTVAECQTEKHRQTCLGLDDMLSIYQIFGCEN
ncbi:complement C3-like isoform X2 [Centropristis striata]|uniref:complement C3-like isoform X2 n=1 Tax=Centropristis striata TaxID=184440 RepID=UPI0027E15A75|nr:complement C3-like isoform X2 [Centropristis striata]